MFFFFSFVLRITDSIQKICTFRSFIKQFQSGHLIVFCKYFIQNSNFFMLPREQMWNLSLELKLAYIKDVELQYQEQ